MASVDHASDSEDSDMVDLLKTPKKKKKEEEEEEEENIKELSMPGSGLSHRFRTSPQIATDEQPRVRSSTSEEKRISVMVQGPSRPWEYQPFVGENTVDTVLAEVDEPGGEVKYRIEYEDGRREDVSLEDLLNLRNGRNALDFYNNGDEDVQSDSMMGDSQLDRSSAELSVSSSNGKRLRTKTKQPGFVDSTQITSDEGSQSNKKRRLRKGRVSLISTNGQRTSSRLSLSRTAPDEVPDSESDVPRKSGLRSSNRISDRQTRNASKTQAPLMSRNTARDDDEVDELAESDGSEIAVYQPKKKLKGRFEYKGKRGRPRLHISESDASSDRPEPTRKSGRERVIKSMKEQDMNEEIYADDVAVKQTSKVISIREIYQPVSKDSHFYAVHSKECDVCGTVGSSSNKGSLVHCQGCSSSIHKNCLGYRSGREHMVTKVGHENFVMQCRRCIGLASKKDPLAPRLDTCQNCKEPGRSCAAFSTKKTAKQEEKIRKENGDDDPITEVSTNLINSSDNVLFRCEKCRRAWHFEHLPPLDDESETPEDLEELHELRLIEYSSQWKCKDCLEMPGKVEKLVAWRPVNQESYKEGQTLAMFREDDKEYLVKWLDKSYFKCTWMPGGWVWGVTAGSMRKGFINHDEGANNLPKWTFEDAVREEYLRIEIVFEVQYNGYRPKSEKSDKAHITDIDKVFVKFQGLSYDEAVWDDPPTSDDEDRWSDFVAAYNEYLAGKYFKQQTPAVLKARVKDFRELDFQKEIELKDQPSAVVGGEIMDYQKEGMNWLLWNFHQQNNVILADEMGLGKTIQVIAFIAALVTQQPKCWPFLVVTPNSTCPNWRREIKKWAPSLRVVAYYGGKEARDMAMQYELFPGGCSDMRAHVVITSYEGPVNNSTFFKQIKWTGMIVDEGQRLKNDQNLLYSALKALKTPFQALLTGTPLQNNKRELFNLLQFCKPSLKAAELDKKYEVLTKENIPELHELIRPFFLRRTKLAVLKLPPMAQVILPVTMSVLQKKLCKSIMSRNSDLITSLLDRTKILRPKDRGNLNNLLMQLRKVLCHPYFYSSAIEEKGLDEDAMQRNLIDASSKFQLLEIMLPKLRERGHRVLLFSQFLDHLDIVEDFMNGLGLPFTRLDGKMSAMEKQREIDAFNAPNSELFAFLLSTRAGGVGINLATADTVIIMDPDFNPHQDIQALSRAHRIGQKKKVLCFQLMTKDSAEEKMVQIGRKKMALDQALIESIDSKDDIPDDLESVLKHGAAALFSNDDQNDIHYNSISVDQLLDRTQVENTETGKDKTAESQFSFARVWANDKGTLTEGVGDPDAEAPGLDQKFWENILEQRNADAAAEKAKNVEALGRGKRAKVHMNYGADDNGGDEAIPQKPGRKRRGRSNSASDVDFVSAGDSDGDDDLEGIDAQVDAQELGMQSQRAHSRSKFIAPSEDNANTVQRPSETRKAGPRVSRTSRSPTASSSNSRRRPQYSPGYVSVSDIVHQNYTRIYGPYVPPSSAGGLQHADRHGENEGRPGAELAQGESIPRHSPQLSSGQVARVHVAGATVQRPTGNRPYTSSQSQNSGAVGGRLSRCRHCYHPHIGVSRDCPLNATESQLRIMIDSLRELKSTMSEHDFRIYDAILWGQIGSRIRSRDEARRAMAAQS